MTTVTLNDTQRLFVLKSDGGFTCLGYDVVFRRLRQFAALLGLPAPDSARIGTMAQYQDYCDTEARYISTQPTSTLFDPDTPAAVCAVLEACRQSRRRVRLFLGDSKTGRDWLEEHDVLGRIGRSMGPLKVPLLVLAGENGGSAILTACVLRILDAESRRELYRHPKYQVPQFRLAPSTTPDRSHEVYVGDEVHVRFKSEQAAQHWMLFMQGLRMTAR